MEQIAVEHIIKEPFSSQVDKKKIPTCSILGVNIAAINMNWLLSYLQTYMKTSQGNLLSGDYICVSNVHTTVTAYEHREYMKIQNTALMAIPDGGPLASFGQKCGFSDMRRTTGPDLMDNLFRVSKEKGYRHYFFGSTPDTLEKLYQKLNQAYPGISIAGTYSPPFRGMTQEEDLAVIEAINLADADFVWIGLGCPKQEQWMLNHKGKVKGLMIGVGAGFDYFAGNIHRAPRWMQTHNLEWFYRLLQDPKRLFKRYIHTNAKFLIHTAYGRK